MESELQELIKIFICYAHEDDEYRKTLVTHFEGLKRQNLIDVWYDRKIDPGMDWKSEIDSHLKSAQIILLLVSPDFMASDYCYGIEMKRAMERHESGEACVIPVILRPVYWAQAPFSKLQALPPDAVPIVDRSWHSKDEAFFKVVEGIRESIENLLNKPYDDLLYDDLLMEDDPDASKPARFPSSTIRWNEPSSLKSSARGTSRRTGTNAIPTNTTQD